MTRWRDMNSRDKVVVWLAGIVGVFVLLSVTAVFVLELLRLDTGDVWQRVFDLVGVLAGGLVGFIAGQAYGRGSDEDGDRP